MPSKKVVWGVLRRLNTFSEGSWIPKKEKPNKKLPDVSARYKDSWQTLLLGEGNFSFAAAETLQQDLVPQGLTPSNLFCLVFPLKMT